MRAPSRVRKQPELSQLRSVTQKAAADAMAADADRADKGLQRMERRRVKSVRDLYCRAPQNVSA